MKILWVRSAFLQPIDSGGNIVSFEILRRLHRRHTVHFVSYLREGQDPSAAGEYCTSACPVPPPQVSERHLRPFALRIFKEWLSPLPYDVAPLATTAMRREIARVMKTEQCDLIVSDMLQVFPNVPNPARCVLFEHNVEAMLARRTGEAASGFLLKLHARVHENKLAALERRTCRKAAHVIAISEADARTLRETHAAKRVSPVAIGVDAKYFAPPPASQPRSDLVFLGTQSWPPNIDGILWFVRDVLPRIRAIRPDCTLVIAGQRPAPEIVDLGKRDPLITVTGTVPDIRPWLWGASVSIVPLRIGGGVRIKIYEAMAAGIPVISTSIGAEGLDVQPPDNIRICDSAVEFAGTCLELLDKAAERRRMANRALETVRAKYTWDSTAEQFEAILRAVADNRR